MRASDTLSHLQTAVERYEAGPPVKSGALADRLRVRDFALVVEKLSTTMEALADPELGEDLYVAIWRCQWALKRLKAEADKNVYGP